MISQFKNDRAEILQIVSEIKVKFLDYGNISTVVSNKVWNISTDHCTIPVQCVRCKLFNIQSIEPTSDRGASWSKECIKYFTEDEYRMKIIVNMEDEDELVHVELISKQNEQSVGSILIQEGFGVPLVQEDIVQVEDPIDEQILVNQILAVHVACIENSNKFFIHVEPDKLDSISSKIKELVQNPEELYPLTSDNIVEGKFILASTDGTVWYRARIVCSIETGARIQFVDYGDVVDVTLENIRDIVEPLCIWSPQAFECCLYGNDAVLDEALETEFLDLYSDTNITIYVTGVDDKNRLSLVIYNDNCELQTKFQSNLSNDTAEPDISNENGTLKYPKTVSKLVNYPIFRQGEKILISHTNQNHFFVQKVSNEMNLNEFVEKFNEFYNTTAATNENETKLNSGNIKLNNLYAVKSIIFDTWYRAQVINLDPLEMLYVDYGNTEEFLHAALVEDNRITLLNESHYYPPKFALQVKCPVKFVKDNYEILNNELVYVVEYYKNTKINEDDESMKTNQSEGNEKTIINKDNVEWIVILKDKISGEIILEKLMLQGIVDYDDTYTSMTESSEENNQIFTSALTLASLSSSTSNQSLLNRLVSLNSASVSLITYDSPTNFTIQLKSDSQNLEYLQSYLQIYKKKSFPILYYTNEICIGRYTQDNQWYRCKIINQDYNASFIDYGNESIVPEIRKLNYTLKNIASYSLKCKLPIVPKGYYQQNNSHSVWNQDIIDKFNTIIDENNDVSPLNEATETSSSRIVQLIIYQHIPFVDLIINNQSIVNKFVQEDLCEMVKLKVIITHINSIHNFYVQYISDEATFNQDNKNNGDITTNVKDFIDIIYDNLETIEINQPLKLHQLKINDLIACKYPIDDCWYRAKIINITKVEKTSDENGQISKSSFENDVEMVEEESHVNSGVEEINIFNIEVLFIDFGNTCSNIQHFRQLPSNIYSIPPLAYNYSIKLNFNENKDADVQESDENVRLEKITNKFIQLSNDGNTQFYLKLINMNENLIELFDLNMKNIENDLLNDSVIDNVHSKHGDYNIVQDDTNEFKYYILTHINSANDFYIQRDDDENVDIVNEEIEKGDNVTGEKLQLGDVVAAKFIDDGNWYRAKIIKKGNASEDGAGEDIEVLFIDYGNQSKAFEFKKLNKKLTNLEPLALHCKLIIDNIPESESNADTKNVYSIQCTEKFIRLSNAGETIYACDFIGQDKQKQIHYVDLYIGNERVVDLIISENDTNSEKFQLNEESSRVLGVSSTLQLTPSKKILTTEIDKCNISEIISPDCFYIQELDDGDLEFIQEHIEINENLEKCAQEDLYVGNIVIAQFIDDDCWYRAKILGKNIKNENVDSTISEDNSDTSNETIDSHEYRVLFIDYGNESFATEFRKLPTELNPQIILPCAKLCRLIPPGNINTWSDKSIMMFKQYVNAPLKFEYIEESNVTLVDHAGEVSNDVKNNAVINTVELYTLDDNHKISYLITEYNDTIDDYVYEQHGDLASNSNDQLEVIKEMDMELDYNKEEIEEDITEIDENFQTYSNINSSPQDGAAPQSLKDKYLNTNLNKIHLITHVNSPSDFYLMIDAEKALKIDRLLNAAEEFGEVDSIIYGSVYAVFCSYEDTWHRGQLLDIVEDRYGEKCYGDGGDLNDDSNELFTVKYIDYGNTDVVYKKHLRELPEKIRKIPNIVENCCLDMTKYQNKGEESSDEDEILWNEKSIKKFNSLVESGRFYIEKNKDGHNYNTPYKVILKTTDGVNVNELLYKINYQQYDEADEDSDNGEDIQEHKANRNRNFIHEHIKSILMKEDMSNSLLNDSFNHSDVPEKKLYQEKVKICYYENRKSFYLHVVKDENILESIQNLLPRCKNVEFGSKVEKKGDEKNENDSETQENNFNNTDEDNDNDILQIGEIYAGLNKKNLKWYRVKIIEKINYNDEKYKSKAQVKDSEGINGDYYVKFIDYGYKDICKKFKYLTEDLKHISSLCHYCSLKPSSTTTGEEIDEEVINNAFKNLIQEEFIVSKVENNENGEDKDGDYNDANEDDEKPQIVKLIIKINNVDKILNEIVFERLLSTPEGLNSYSETPTEENEISMDISPEETVKTFKTRVEESIETPVASSEENIKTIETSPEKNVKSTEISPHKSVKTLETSVEENMKSTETSSEKNLNTPEENVKTDNVVTDVDEANKTENV